MGLIKEPEGVDFIIKSKPLTEKDRLEISKHIADYKKMQSKKRTLKKKANASA